MNRLPLAVMFLFCLTLLGPALSPPSVRGQADAPPPPTLADAKTPDEVEGYLRRRIEAARALVKENDIESIKGYMKTVGEACIAGGDRILALAENDKDREMGYTVKISGLKGVIRSEGSTPTETDLARDTRKKLDELIDELEKGGTFPLLVNNERFQQFAERDGRELFESFSPEKFEVFKEKTKKWALTKPIGFDPLQALMLAVELTESESALRHDPKLPEKTVRDLLAFVGSDACTLPAEQKKAMTEQLEGYCRRCVGADLKLYGKTLDDKDFDWQAYRGKYVLVMFTASWCRPCELEIPGVLAAYEKYKDKGFAVVAVYVMDRLADARRSYTSKKLPWTAVSEELTQKAGQPAQGKTYDIQGVPTMVLVDKEGKVDVTEARSARLDHLLEQRLGEARP